jgi:hypothetical protein
MTTDDGNLIRMITLDYDCIIVDAVIVGCSLVHFNLYFEHQRLGWKNNPKNELYVFIVALLPAV